MLLYFYPKSRDYVVGIATGYGQNDVGVRVRVPVVEGIFTSPCHTGSGVHPTSYPTGTGGKAAGA
jgi:hypothetical protein